MHPTAIQNETLVRDYDALCSDKAQLKGEVDRVSSELAQASGHGERMQARVEQLMRELERLEERVDEEAAKSEGHLQDKKRVVHEKAVLDEALADLRDKQDKLGLERATLDTKLRAVESELLLEKDQNQKLTKDKQNLETQVGKWWGWTKKNGMFSHMVYVLCVCRWRPRTSSW